MKVMLLSVAVVAAVALGGVDAMGDEIAPGLYRLRGTDPALPDDDLEPLLALVGDAQVAGLGESIHTSGGYSELKHRVFKYLVEHMGFRVFGFETSWSPAISVDEYVQTCQGSPELALRGVFGVWRSEETVELVRWMCEWNQEHPDDRVHFFGFDAQQPEADSQALVRFLTRIGLQLSDPLVRDVFASCVFTTLVLAYPEDEFEACTGALDRLDGYFDDHEAEIIATTSAEELELARIHLVGFRSWQGESYYLGWWDTRAIESRDAAMAEIFLRLSALWYPGHKSVIWAHNYHIQRASQSSAGTRTMGSFLDDRLGAAYVVLGLIGYDVAIDWPQVGCGGPTAFHGPASAEQVLHDLGEPYLFLDLAATAGSGAPLDPAAYYVISDYIARPGDIFDGVFFLDYSRGMAPIGWPPCEPADPAAYPLSPTASDGGVTRCGVGVPGCAVAPATGADPSGGTAVSAPDVRRLK